MKRDVQIGQIILNRLRVFVFFVEKFAFLSGNAPQPEYFKSHTGMKELQYKEGKIPA